MKKIALIPIDNRPVCYNLVKEIAKIDFGINVSLPDRSLLGDLTATANVDGIMQWFKNIDSVDSIVISLDTVAYGGLIPSRRSEDSLEDIKSRMMEFKEVLKSKNAKIYAFSSIMRISNNNINEEEKEYWSQYGKKIFKYSFNFHKNNGEAPVDIPLDILEDYIETRKRNFEINKMYLEWLEEGIFDTLVFSKDDCAEFGLNVMEAQKLQKIINEKNLSALVKTGADEIPLTLMARAVTDLNNEAMKVSVRFLAPEYKNLISNYEDISIEKSVYAQLELAGCKITNADVADLILIVNNFEQKQGEIVMGRSTKHFSGDFKLPERPYMIADVRFANGADNEFVDKIFQNDLNFDNFYGYSAWNTSANTLGSLICTAVVRFYSESEGGIFAPRAFKKLQMIRFLDDWAYQANARQPLRQMSTNPDLIHLKRLMFPFQKRLNNKLGINPEIDYRFPWKRFFEVEVIIK